MVNTQQKINFEYKSFELTAESKDTLRLEAQSILAAAATSVEVRAHTDSIGSDNYNFKLSDQRAASVGEFLISQGIARDILITRGYGETSPIASNETDEGRAQNRRVELIYQGEICD